MDLNEFLKKEVIGDDNFLIERIDSQRFKLSSEIMRLESDLNISQDKAAQLLEIKLDKLLSMEAADKLVTIDSYEETIKILKSTLNRRKLYNKVVELNVDNKYDKISYSHIDDEQY